MQKFDPRVPSRPHIWRRVLTVRWWQWRANFHAWRRGLPWGLCAADEEGWRRAYVDGMTPAEYGCAARQIRQVGRARRDRRASERRVAHMAGVPAIKETFYGGQQDMSADFFWGTVVGAVACGTVNIAILMIRNYLVWAP